MPPQLPDPQTSAPPASAESELYRAYAEWRRLAEAEGEAIRAGNWSFLRDCHNALSELQVRIDSLNEQAAQEWAALGIDAAPRRAAFKTMVKDLLKIEHHNHHLLEQRRRKMMAQKEELGIATLNLRRIQKSYTQAASATFCSVI